MAFVGRGSSLGTGPRALRRVLAVVGVLLVVIVIGFLVAGKLRAKNWVQGLPGRLGMGISQDSNSFTYDQSSKGKKIFTVHAAKEVQRTDGKVSLHDVGIVMYGPTGQPSDRIHGTDFTYDQKGQLLTAVGEVFIDLVPPATKDATGAVIPMDPEELDRKMVHVKTIGLVFDQKGGLASSDGPVEFRTAGYTGNSVGATYDSKNNVIVLKSQVRMSGIRDERPVVLTASYAEMDRKANVIDLQSPHYVSAGATGAETASAHHALIHTNAAGDPEKINAEGNVTLTSDQRGTVISDKLDLDLGDKGQAQAAHLYGNVKYASDEGVKRENGRADDAKISFDAVGRPVRALMNGGVTFLEQGPADMRNLESATLDVTLGGGGKEPIVVRAADAFGPGGATLKLADDDAKGRTATDIKADKLVGRFAPSTKTTELTGLDGTGHSSVQRVVHAPNGTQTSRDDSAGDVLHVDFKPGDDGHSELTRAEQKGGVATVHEAVRIVNGKASAPTVEHSRADDEVYEAGPNVAHLIGNVEVQDETSALTADKVDVNRGTGDAFAYGAVKVTYVSAPAAGAPAPKTPQEPVHVLAARAIAHKASGLSEFFGSGNELARMWQGTSQVEAPVLDFYRTEKKLVAHGDPGSDSPMVRAVLVSGAGSGTKAKGLGSNGGTTHIVSKELVYTDSARTVEFTGAVRVIDQDGTLTSKQATVWLTPAGTNSPAAQTSAPASSGFMGGRVDHMVATGSVVLDQPGRRGTGDKLVYTASDGVYVLTGTKAVPPKVMDQAQGTTTGAALRFRSGDDSVEVLGSEDGKTAGRVRTETRMKQ
jgi:lipopolysaccharide export system protein LptA